MRISEWIVCGFFAYLTVLAWIFPLSGRRRARVLLVGLVCVGLVVMLSQLRLRLPMRVARDWVPALYLLEVYWLCGLCFERPMRAVEDRLLQRWTPSFRQLSGQIKVKSGVIGQAASGCDGAG